MTIPRNEQGTILIYDRELDEWYYYSDIPKHNRKWRDFVSETRTETSKNGVITVLEGTINGSVSIRKHTVMSGETRAKATARLKAYRDKKVEDEK